MSAMSTNAATIEAKRSGVYRTPAHADALRKAAGNALTWFDVPLQSVSNKKQFLTVCAKQLKLPSHFGDNWDALADCVRDLSWAPGGAGYVLRVSGSEKFAKAAPEDYQTALAVLREAAVFWKDQGTPFVVFVDAAKDLPTF